jgi:hypothetical protein
MILPTSEGVRRDRDMFDLAEGEARDAQNWIRREKRVMIRPGLTYWSSDSIERPLAILQYDHDDEAGRIVCLTTVGFYHFNRSTLVWDDKTGGTPLNGVASTQAVIRTMNYGGETTVLFTNGIDNPKKWDGVTATISDIGGTPPKCGSMAVAFNRLLLGNIKSGADPSGQSVDVSEYRNPDDGYGGTVQQQFLLDVNGDIVTMESIGNRRVGVYLEDGIYVATATGGEFPFRFDLAYRRMSGPVSLRALVPTPDGHVFLARDGTLRLFNGSNLTVIQRDINDDRIHAYVRQTMDFAERAKAWLAYNPVLNELHVHYVPIGSTDVVGGFILKMSDLSLWPMLWSVALPAGGYLRRVSSPAYSEVLGAYSSHDGSYADFLSESEGMVFLQLTGKVLNFTGFLDIDIPISHFIETGIRPAGDPRTAAVLRYANHLIEPTGEAAQVMNIQFGASEYGEDRTLEDSQTVTLNTGASRTRRETHHALRGAMFALRLSGYGSQSTWRGSQVFVDPVGD